jgi:heparan-alpha-glucosaminide N-acetyltransferase
MHTQQPTATVPSSPRQRLESLDVYRGLTMLLLAFTAANWGWQEPIAEAYPWLRSFLDQFEHVAWQGLTLWDMIQPSFMFMVGVSLPYSYASRKRRGATDAELWRHAAVRALLLVLLGIFLRSVGHDETYWTLEDVVSQIGLAYLPLFWLATRTPRVQVIAIGMILLASWLLFALWPVPTIDPNVITHFTGFWAHWNQNVGPGVALDRWLLNLPPRSEPFVINDGGYYTLNFLPSLATMALGLLAGQTLKSERTAQAKLLWHFGWGTALIALGVALDLSGVCPLVKKNWTPTFALVSGGLCLWILGALYGLIDIAGVRRWSWPAGVVGRNPLAMYIMTWTLASWVLMNLTTHLGADVFAIFGETYARLLGNLAVGVVLWLICWWMDRNKIYLRI